MGDGLRLGMVCAMGRCGGLEYATDVVRDALARGTLSVDEMVRHLERSMRKRGCWHDLIVLLPDGKSEDLAVDKDEAWGAAACAVADAIRRDHWDFHSVALLVFDLPRGQRFQDEARLGFPGLGQWPYLQPEARKIIRRHGLLCNVLTRGLASREKPAKVAG